jgi:hypothetical protein
MNLVLQPLVYKDDAGAWERDNEKIFLNIELTLE